MKESLWNYEVICLKNKIKKKTNYEQSTIFHMEGDVVVLHEIARQWVMRYGSQVIAIYNEAFDSEGIPPVNGTLIPGVARITKEPT